MQQRILYPLPPVQESYDETTQDIVYPDSVKQAVKEGDFSKKRIKSIIAAHYGYYLDRFTLEQEDLQTFIAHQYGIDKIPTFYG